jgi:hypothetical protein
MLHTLHWLLCSREGNKQIITFVIYKNPSLECWWQFWLSRDWLFATNTWHLADPALLNDEVNNDVGATRKRDDLRLASQCRERSNASFVTRDNTVHLSS